MNIEDTNDINVDFLVPVFNRKVIFKYFDDDEHSVIQMLIDYHNIPEELLNMRVANIGSMIYIGDEVDKCRDPKNPILVFSSQLYGSTSVGLSIRSAQKKDIENDGGGYMAQYSDEVDIKEIINKLKLQNII